MQSQPTIGTSKANLLVLSYRFAGDKEYRTLEAQQSDINDFLNDFSWHGVNDLFARSKYIKRSKIKALQPNDSFIEYFISGSIKDAVRLAQAKMPQAQPNQPKRKTLALQTQVTEVLRQKRNLEHDACFVRLHEFVTVTCTETGISFSCQLPVPDKLNLEVLHPLSFYSNVQETIRAYSKKGIYLETELTAQVLAGMLLTILRHKKLIVCRDYVKANLCLQKIKVENLSFSVRFFNSLPSAVSLPQLHLIPEALYDFYNAPISLTKEQIIADRTEIMLHNFIKVCKGDTEGETRIAGTILKTRNEKSNAKVRIYGGNADIEHRQATGREKLGKQILVKLQTKYPVPFHSQVFYDMLYSKLDAFMYLGTEKRIEISRQIIESFGEDKLGKELANIFATTKTETMELSLSSFSHELESDLGEWKGQKRKFNLFASQVIKDEKDNND